MSYKNLKTTGKIIKIDPTHLNDKTNDSSLIFPDQVYTTRIKIQTSSNGSTSSDEVYCALPMENLNKEAELVQSYFFDPEEHVSTYVQQLYIDKKLVMNQAIVMQK